MLSGNKNGEENQIKKKKIALNLEMLRKAFYENL